MFFLCLSELRSSSAAAALSLYLIYIYIYVYIYTGICVYISRMRAKMNTRAFNARDLVVF